MWILGAANLLPDSPQSRLCDGRRSLTAAYIIVAAPNTAAAAITARTRLATRREVAKRTVWSLGLVFGPGAVVISVLLGVIALAIIGAAIGGHCSWR